jgi:hypothetical protein
LSRWLDPLNRADSDDPIIATAMAPMHGWLAVVSVQGMPRFISCAGDAVSEDARRFLDLADHVGGSVLPDDQVVRHALDQLAKWMAKWELRDDIGLESGFPSAKRAVLDRLSRSVARAPRHRRAALLAAAQRARAGVCAVAGIGAERILEELVRSAADDDAWVHSVDAFSAMHHPAPCGDHRASSIGALIVLQPPPDQDYGTTARASAVAGGQP